MSYYSPIAENAITTGQLNAVIWVVERVQPKSSAVLSWVNQAALSGSLSVLEWAADNSNLGPPWTSLFSDNTFLKACIGGHIATLDWLYERQGVTYDKTSPKFVKAASKANFDAVDWLRARDFAVDLKSVTLRAVSRGKLEYLEKTSPGVFDQDHCARAAKHGCLDILK